MNTWEQALNLKVKITTTVSDQAISGSIFACSSNNELIALKVSNPSNKTKTDGYRFVNTAFIKTVQVLPPFPSKKGPAPQTKTQVALHDIPLKDLEFKLNNAIADYDDKQEINPPKTLPFGTRVFEKLSKVHGEQNVKWQGNDTIIIHDEIKVSRPYTLSKRNVQKLSQNSKHLEPVQNTLREFWLAADNEKRGG